jgi:hypothetical protein
MRAVRHTLTLLIVLAAASRVSAQPAHADRLRINIDAGGQFSSSSFATTTTKPVYLENASIQASDEVRRGLLADAGVSWRIAGDFAIGVTASWFMATNDADISASVPHPFFFKTPRTLTGTASLHREEMAAHIQAIYTVHANRTVDVALSGGPSFFELRQDVVTDIAFADTYPYEAPTLTSASTQQVSASHIGYNAGVDVSVRLSRHAGLGGGVRFSKATIDLAVPNGGGTVSVDAGGAQAIGGLRLYF